MYCKYCGKPIDKEATVCKHCGKSLILNENVAEEKCTYVEKEPLRKVLDKPKEIKNKKRILFLSIVVVLSVLIAYGTIFVFNRTSIADVTIDKVSKELADATNDYDKLYGFQEGLAKVCKNEKYGFIDKLGHEIIPCVYDKVEDFYLGVSIVTKDEKKGAINQQGHWVIPCKYDYISGFSKDSLTAASINGKFGFIDLKGNIVVPFDYESCENFSEGLAAVSKDGLIGFINKKGELVIQCQYVRLYDGRGFSEGLVGVSIDGGQEGIYDDKWGYIDKTGDIVIPFQEGLTGAPFSSGLTTIYRRSTTKRMAWEGAFINKSGELASDYFEVQNLKGFYDGYCVVKDSTGWEGLINLHGNFVIPCKCSFIVNGFDEKYVVFQINDKYGVANKSTGEVVIPCIYEIDYAGWTFSEGVIPVKKDGKYGYINENNQIIIPFVYDEAEAFTEGFAVVKRYGKYGYVDRYGHDTFY